MALCECCARSIGQASAGVSLLMPAVAPLPTNHEPTRVLTTHESALARPVLFTTADVDCSLRRDGMFTRRGRDRLLAALCADGTIVRVRRGLYARAHANGHGPAPWQVAAQLAPDAVLGFGTALALRGVAPPAGVGSRCTYFTRHGTGRLGVVWRGVAMCPVSHPTALLRSGAAFVETEVMDGTGAGPLRVSTLERTFVDLLERPRLTGAWPEVLRVVGTFPELDLDRVVCYVRCLDNATTAAKAGWILECCERQFGTTRTVLHRLEALRPRGPHYLSRTDRESGRYLARWRLVVPATL